MYNICTQHIVLNIIPDGEERRKKEGKKERKEEGGKEQAIEDEEN